MSDNEKRETHADIIAEMRMGNTGPYLFAYLIGRAGGPLGNVIEQVTVKELADRLEAASRRAYNEIDSAVCEIPDLSPEDIAHIRTIMDNAIGDFYD